MIAELQNDCAAREHVFAVGDRVYLRGARFGLPGTVLRMERGRAVIYWRDMDHISRHRPVTLMPAEVSAMELSQ
jgi:hypothetical protein